MVQMNSEEIEHMEYGMNSIKAFNLSCRSALNKATYQEEL